MFGGEKGSGKRGGHGFASSSGEDPAAAAALLKQTKGG